MRSVWCVGAASCLWLSGTVLFGSEIVSARAEQAQTAQERVGLSVGLRPPDFSATDLNGTSHTLAQHRGKVVVLHFWASWCPYCRSEIPELTQLHGEWTSKGVLVLTISADEDLAALQRFVAQRRLPYPVIADLKARPSVVDRYRLSGVPTTYVVGRDGRIAVRIDGAGDLIRAVEQTLSRSPAT